MAVTRFLPTHLDDLGYEEDEPGFFRTGADLATKFVGGIPKAAAGLVGLGSYIPVVNELADPASAALNRGGQYIEDNLLSDYQQQKDRELGQVLASQDGFVDSASAAAGYLWGNPGQALMTAVGSVPSMFAGGVVAKGVKGLGMLAGNGAARAAIGEGAVIAGSVGSDIANQNPDDFMARYYGLAAGAGGAAIGRLGGKLMGGNDIDTMIANGMSREVLEAGGPLNLLKSMPKRVGLGVVGEGLVEEAPQSMLERSMTNLGTNKEWDEGLGAEAVIGGAAGGVMGGAAGLRRTPNSYTMDERNTALGTLQDEAAPIEARMAAARFLERMDAQGKPQDLLAQKNDALNQNNWDAVMGATDRFAQQQEQRLTPEQDAIASRVMGNIQFENAPVTYAKSAPTLEQVETTPRPPAPIGDAAEEGMRAAQPGQTLDMFAGMQGTDTPATVRPEAEDAYRVKLAYEQARMRGHDGLADSLAQYAEQNFGIHPDQMPVPKQEGQMALVGARGGIPKEAVAPKTTRAKAEPKPELTTDADPAMIPNPVASLAAKAAAQGQQNAPQATETSLPVVQEKAQSGEPVPVPSAASAEVGEGVSSGAPAATIVRTEESLRGDLARAHAKLESLTKGGLGPRTRVVKEAKSEVEALSAQLQEKKAANPDIASLERTPAGTVGDVAKAAAALKKATKQLQAAAAIKGNVGEAKTRRKQAISAQAHAVQYLLDVASHGSSRDTGAVTTKAAAAAQRALDQLKGDIHPEAMEIAQAREALIQKREMETAKGGEGDLYSGRSKRVVDNQKRADNKLAKDMDAKLKAEADAKRAEEQAEVEEEARSAKKGTVDLDENDAYAEEDADVMTAQDDGFQFSEEDKGVSKEDADELLRLLNEDSGSTLEDFKELTDDEANVAESLFLSDGKEGERKRRRFGRAHRLARSLRAASDWATNILGRGSLGEVTHNAPLGRFSGYRTNASLDEDGTLNVEVFGKEQIDAGLTAEPALTFNITPKGELIVNGPSPIGKTFKEFEKRGWAERATVKGEVIPGWSRLIGEGIGGTLPLRQVVGLLGDVHARAKNNKRISHIGLEWHRSTGMLGLMDLDGGKSFFSEGQDSNGTTVSAITNTLNKLFFSPARLNQIVTVYPTQEAANAATKGALSEAKGKVKGFTTPDGKVGLIAENIPAGKELGVALHEIGVHLGMKKLVGEANMVWLAGRVEEWAKRTDDSVTTRVAKAAVARAANSSSKDKQEELIAYMVEGLVNEGVNPEAAGTTDAHVWFRKLWAAAKSALRKLGFKNPNFSGKDLVNLAYGAADLELQGAWHGTAADFRNFNHSYMGSGEGAQAFGWGTYLAQGVGIAKGYWKADVRRKMQGGSEYRQVFFDGAPLSKLYPDDNDAFYFDVDEFPMDTSSPSLKAALIKNIENKIRQIDGMLANKREPNDAEDAEFMAEYDKRARAEQETLKAALVRLRTAHSDRFSTPNIKTDGSLMRVAANVRDEEYLDWDKPLSEQSDLVEKALRASEHFKARNGQFLAEGETGKGLYDHLKNVLGSDKKASEYLDSIGIKGIKFLDANSRNSSLKSVRRNFLDALDEDAEADDVLAAVRDGGFPANEVAFIEALAADDWLGFDYPAQAISAVLKAHRGYYELSPALVKAIDGLEGPKTHNLVIFNDKNIQRVSTQVGASRDSSKIKFSEVGAGKTAPKTVSELRTFSERTWAQNRKGAWSTATDLTNKALDKVMFTHDLIARAKKQGLTAATAYKLALDQKDQIKNQMEGAVDRIMQDASKLTDGPAVKQFLKQMTMERNKNWRDTDEYKALSPEGKKVAAAVFAHGEATSKEIKRLMLAEINAEFDALNKRFPTKSEEHEKGRRAATARVERVMPMNGEPYAPLKRFGDYVVVAKSQAYLDAEKNGDEAKMDALKHGDGEAHYAVFFHDSQGNADLHADQIEAENPGWFKSITASTKQKQYGSMDQLPWSGIAKVKQAVENDPDFAGKDGMHRLLTDLYLQLLAETSARKSELGRMGKGRGVEGAGDMFRAFAAQGRSMAHFVSNLAKSPEINKQIATMRAQAREDKDLNSTLNEINARYAQGLDYQETPLVDKTLRATSVMMLMTSPAYYITNATQTFMVTLPILGGKYGKKAFDEMTKAYKEVMPIIKNFGHGFDVTTLGKTAEEKAMLQRMLETGRIDITQASDLGRWAEGSETQGPIAKSMDWVNGIFTKVEAMNRLTAALTAHRLAASDTEFKTEADRLEYTADVIDRTQGNYAGNNAPRFFRANGAMKMVTQFRKYQLIQISLVSKLAHDSLKGSTADEKRVARQTLAWLMTQQMLLTGVKGLPIPAVALMLAGMMGGDDDKDWERNLRKYIGDDDIANLLTRGVPAAMGLDLSGRVGMGNAFSPLPYTDMEVSKKGFKEAAFGFMGPSAAMGANFAEGIGKVMDGQYWKGMENMAPSGLRNAMAGYRMATDGVTNTRGDVQLSPDEVGFAAGLAKGLGLPTTNLTDAQRGRDDLYDLGSHFHDKDSNLKNAYAAAAKDRDTAEMADLRKQWTETQEAKKRWVEEMKRQGLGAKELVTRIKPQPLSSLLKAPQAQAKRERAWQ